MPPVPSQRQSRQRIRDRRTAAARVLPLPLRRLVLSTGRKLLSVLRSMRASRPRGFRTEYPTSGYETLDRYWLRWAAASTPPMTPAIFQSFIVEHCDTFKNWLATDSEQPLVVAADSKGEAIAFLSCMLQHDDVVARKRKLAVAFHSIAALRKLSWWEEPFISVILFLPSESWK